MSATRPYCLSIAGFDPCGGAGVLADIKVFEHLKVFGFGVSTALTYQNESEFSGVSWFSMEQIEQQILPLKQYPLATIKIGLIQNFIELTRIIELVKELFPDASIVWDPVLKATAGFEFHKQNTFSAEVLRSIELITPNYDEFRLLGLNELENVPCNILLKGGHRNDKPGTDTLISKDGNIDIKGAPFENKKDKHGTGCILSSAIAAHLALDKDLPEACKLGKKLVEQVILSNDTKLGYLNT